MAGLFNTGVRDYCGDESSVTKLSNHFSKDFAFQQEGINNHVQDIGNNVPTSFKFSDLLKDTINDNDFISKNDEKPDENITGISSVKFEDSGENSFSENWNYPKLYQPQGNYIPVPNLSVTHNVPMPQFVPPDPSAVARHWAEHELSKFDDKVIMEQDLTSLGADKDVSKIRFIDIIREVAINDEQADLDILNDNQLTNGNGNILYDLDSDLRSMRDKVQQNADNQDVWAQISKSLEEITGEIIFNKSNHYLNELNNMGKTGDVNKDVDEILQKGIMLYKKGEFSEAILAFEAVVQMKPDVELGWSYLGMSLSENEQDHRAIIACKKCLELNKNNREVLLSLARIHCNEMNLSSTIACLEQWLLAHPKYSSLATVGQEAMHSATANNSSLWDDMYDMACESSGKFAIIDEQFNLALNQNQFDIDPELEIAAGTLYHAVQDYERATIRFEAAVSVIKDNACLWNKLGTTHCNAGNYEKAISAYRKALELAPGFARAECNIGVAFFNTESYREAIQHAIKACKIQHAEKLDNIKTSYDNIMESDPIWTLIRMASFKLDGSDLDPLIFSRDIEKLSMKFDV